MWLKLSLLLTVVVVCRYILYIVKYYGKINIYDYRGKLEWRKPGRPGRHVKYSVMHWFYFDYFNFQFSSSCQKRIWGEYKILKSKVPKSTYFQLRHLVCVLTLSIARWVLWNWPPLLLLIVKWVISIKHPSFFYILRVVFLHNWRCSISTVNPFKW